MAIYDCAHFSTESPEEVLAQEGASSSAADSDAKMEQLEQSLQRKLRADTEQQVVKLRKEVEEEVIPQCAVVKEMRGELHKC